MSQVEHRITLDLTSPRSVEPIQLFTNDLSAYVITVKITEYGNEKPLSGYSGAKLVIEGFKTEDFPTGVIGADNRIRFSLDDVSIQDGWSVCSVRLLDGITPVETQVFQIYKVVNNPIQVDETPFRTLSQEQLLELVNLADNMEGADAAALRRLKNTASFPSGDTDVDTGLNVDNLQRITYDDIVKLANMALITEVTDDAQHSSSGSRIDNGVLHINPTITDVRVNNNSVVTDGIAAMSAASVIPAIRIRDNKNSTGNLISEFIINNHGEYDIKILSQFLETIVYNGTVKDIMSDKPQGKYAVSIEALEGVVVGSSELKGNARHPYLELEAGSGISLTPSTYDNKVTIGFNGSSGDIHIPVENISVPAGAGNGYILTVDEGVFTAVDLKDALDIDIEGSEITINENISQTFDFVDFTRVQEPIDSDLQPFINYVVNDVDGEYYYVNGDYTKTEPPGYTGHTYSQVGKKITWEDMMSTFKKSHRNEYFTKTLVGTNWGSSTSYSLTITASDLLEHDLTAEQVIDSEGIYHTHAHVHPVVTQINPNSVYNYANYGVYCSGAYESSGDVVFTFVRNSNILVMPNMDVTIEVRIG